MGFRKSIPCIFLFAFVALAFFQAPPTVVAQQVQDELTRRVKTRVQPVYPDLARRMSVKGNVKLMVTVGPNGKVKSTKVMGGHPLLVVASEDAIRQWKFEPASEDTSGVVEFKFQAQAQ